MQDALPVVPEPIPLGLSIREFGLQLRDASPGGFQVVARGVALGRVIVGGALELLHAGA